jgi:nitroreductase
MEVNIQTIKSRRSVRSFDGAPLAESEKRAITASFREHSIGPFGNRSRFVLVETSGPDDFGKVGTYGTIRNAPAYILGAVKKSPRALVDFGYCLQGIILEATALGLGTVWLGGFFSRPDVRRVLVPDDDELVPAAVPVGKSADSMSLVERIIRRSAAAKSRKPFSELFFDGELFVPLKDPGPWEPSLECLRLGPSASNKQPWRIIRVGDPMTAKFRFYLREDKVYNNAIGGIRIQEIDMGIAMCNFETASKSLSLPGEWKMDEGPEFSSPYIYIATWV